MIWYFLIPVLALALGGVVFMLIYTMPIARRVYRDQLVRTEKEKWGRVCSAPQNEEQQAMWDAGVTWAQENADKMTEVHVQNEGLNLYGELYQADSKRCVIILPGRCECLKYSYYFAPPYMQAGMNVLVIDTRAHGKSEGVYNTIGKKESGDVVAWMRFLTEQFGMEEIYLHTICIGSAAGMGALTRADCPAQAKGIISEGCFVSFRETFKEHMVADKRPLFPVLDLVMLQIWRHCGTNVYAFKPISLVKKLKGRALFLFGEQDIFSRPPKSRKLFAACSAPDKKIVWFERGGHSHLRINNTEKYDAAIVDFVNENK